MVKFLKIIQNLKDKKNWLPEIYQIGVRNPQGMALSPFDNKIYLTNHGARGGDWFGEAKYGENYGWKILGWGGTNYTGTKIGPKWMPGYTKAIKYWVPSIAVVLWLFTKVMNLKNGMVML
jgi:quinoprotein glucose dehydrogenase